MSASSVARPVTAPTAPRKQCLQLVFLPHTSAPTVTVHHNMGGRKVRMKVLLDTLSTTANFEVITQLAVIGGVDTSFSRGNLMQTGFIYRYASTTFFNWPNQERTASLIMSPTSTYGTIAEGYNPKTSYMHDQVQLVGNLLTFQHSAVGAIGADRERQGTRIVWLELEEIQ